jgi:hypothetical protein
VYREPRPRAGGLTVLAKCPADDVSALTTQPGRSSDSPSRSHAILILCPSAGTLETPLGAFPARPGLAKPLRRPTPAHAHEARDRCRGSCGLRVKAEPQAAEPSSVDWHFLGPAAHDESRRERSTRLGSRDWSWGLELGIGAGDWSWGLELGIGSPRRSRYPFPL